MAATGARLLCPESITTSLWGPTIRRRPADNCASKIRGGQLRAHVEHFLPCTTEAATWTTHSNRSNIAALVARGVKNSLHCLADWYPQFIFRAVEILHWCDSLIKSKFNQPPQITCVFAPHATNTKEVMDKHSSNVAGLVQFSLLYFSTVVMSSVSIQCSETAFPRLHLVAVKSGSYISLYLITYLKTFSFQRLLSVMDLHLGWTDHVASYVTTC